MTDSGNCIGQRLRVRQAFAAAYADRPIPGFGCSILVETIHNCATVGVLYHREPKDFLVLVLTPVDGGAGEGRPVSDRDLDGCPGRERDFSGFYWFFYLWVGDFCRRRDCGSSYRRRFSEINDFPRRRNER